MYTRSWYKMSHRINVNNSQPCSFFWLNSILVNIVFFMYYFSIILSSLIHSVIHCLIHNSVVVKAGCVAMRIKFKCLTNNGENTKKATSLLNLTLT